MFTASNFKNPQLPSNLCVVDVPLTVAHSDAELEGFGWLVEDLADFTAERRTFEVEKWPVQGWRALDPDTGDEAGTTDREVEYNAFILGLG